MELVGDFREKGVRGLRGLKFRNYTLAETCFSKSYCGTIVVTDKLPAILQYLGKPMKAIAKISIRGQQDLL